MARRVKPNRAAATYPLPVVGFLLGVGRNAAYDAAHDEVFPTVRVRGRIVAIAGPINRMLELSGPDDPRVIEAYRLAGLVASPAEGAASETDADRVDARLRAAESASVNT
jgi:hypothetical protein